MDAASVWEKPTETTTYRTETRSFDGMEFTVTRRTLSFPEETRLLAKVIDAKTKRPDPIEMLALTVEAAVKETNFGLTPDRIRKDLPDRPSLMWFLYRWICAETLQNIAPDAREDLEKKSGP